MPYNYATNWQMPQSQTYQPPYNQVQPGQPVTSNLYPNTFQDPARNQSQFRQPQQQQTSPINGFAWVRNKAECDTFLIAPGDSVILMNSELPELYFLSRDQSGKYNPLETYDLVRQGQQRQIPQAQQQPQPLQQQIDTSHFVTAQEVEKMIQSKLDRALGSTKRQPVSPVPNRDKEA